MRATLPLTVFAALALLGCTSQGDREPTPVSVTSSDDTCDVTPGSAQAGTIVFSVQNTGTEVTAFHLLSADDTIVGEVAGIGPGEAHDLVVEAAACEYTTECQQGAQAKGIRTAFSVTDQ